MIITRILLFEKSLKTYKISEVKDSKAKNKKDNKKTINETGKNQ